MKILTPPNLSAPFFGGFTTPALGNQAFSRTNVPSDETRSNREALARELDVEPTDLVSPYLIHSNVIFPVDERHRGRGALDMESAIGEGDGLVTASSRVVLVTTQADCVPILLWDKTTGACSALHAGRKGIVAAIASKAVEVMYRRYGTKPSDLAAAIGPSICPRCYEVDQKTANIYATEVGPWWVYRNGTGWHLHLAAAVRRQLEVAGLAREKINWNRDCTYCHPAQYFSARRMGAVHFQTMAAVIGRRSR